MQMFYKIVASGAEINFHSYSVLLNNLLAAGNWRKYIEVIIIGPSCMWPWLFDMVITAEWYGFSCFLVACFTLVANV